MTVHTIQRRYGYRLELASISTKIIEKFKQDLTLSERDYATGEYKYLQYFLETDKYIYIPTYYFEKQGQAILSKYDYDYTVIEQLETGLEITTKEFSNEFSYREDQEDYVVSALKSNSVIIKRPPGKGKTVIGSSIVLNRGVRTLIIVNQTKLLKQWKRALDLVSGGKLKVGCNKFLIPNSNLEADVHIATIQGIQRKIDSKGASELRKEIDQYRIGQILFDEVHLLIGPEKFSQILYLFPCRYHVSMSATPFRDSDKSKNIIKYWMSEHIVGTSDYTIFPEVKVIPIHSTLTRKNRSYYYVNWTKPGCKWPTFFKDRYIKYIMGHEWYLDLIFDLMYAAWNRKRHILCITHFNKKGGTEDIYKHLLNKFSKINDFNSDDLVIVNGEVKESKRDALLLKPLVISNYHLLTAGADIPTLDTLIMCSPVANQVDLEQVMGRLLREHPDKKTPTVIDLFDIDFDRSKNRWFAIRKEFYDKLQKMKLKKEEGL